MTLALLLISTCLFAELFLRLPILATAAKSAQIARRSSVVIRAGGISDHWKERALPMYSKIILGNTFRLLAYLIIVFVPVAIALVIAEYASLPLWALLSSWRGIGMSIIAAFGYIFVRKRIVGSQL